MGKNVKNVKLWKNEEYVNNMKQAGAELCQAQASFPIKCFTLANSKLCEVLQLRKIKWNNQSKVVQVKYFDWNSLSEIVEVL